MDFDDLLVYTYILFRDFPDVLTRYQDQFHYVLVDEYQDTNYAQHSIILQLTKENQRICVVGDDAQSIYSFRGADIDNILYFTKIYPNTKVFKLEQNYRSTQTIVCAANSLIEKNERQIRKAVFSEKEKGELWLIRLRSYVGNITTDMLNLPFYIVRMRKVVFLKRPFGNGVCLIRFTGDSRSISGKR